MTPAKTDSQGRPISEDGNYIWDGSEWQLTTQSESGHKPIGAARWVAGKVREAGEAAVRKQQADAAAKADAAAETERDRDAALADAQRTCPVPIDTRARSLPGGLDLFNDEFVLAIAKDWGLSSQRLILTTHRLIHSHGRLSKDQQIVYLTDIRDVAFRKPLVGYGSLAIETAGGRSLEGLPTVKNGKAMRDKLLALVHWARQRAAQPTGAQAAAPPSEAPAPSADKYDQLRKLAELKASGVLNESEFEAEKAKLLT